MIRRLVDFSLDHRLLVVGLWLLVAVLGVRSLLRLPIDAVPDVTNVQVQVLTDSPGLAPEEVERFVTFPVETAMSGLPRIEEIRSVSKFGLSVVTVVFEEGSDIYWARQLVSERLTAARDAIPSGYGDPEMGPISTGLGEIYQFEVRAETPCSQDGPDTDDCFTPMELRTILDWQIAYRLRSVPGIVEVNSFGGQLKTFQVTLDAESLTAYGLAVGDVLEAVRASNRAVGGGYLVHQSEQYLVRGEALVQGLDDIRRIVLAHDEAGTAVTVDDLAVVELAPRIRQGAVTRDGAGEAVVGIVMMLRGENSRVVVDRVKSAMAEIEATLPDGVVIDPYYDRTELIRRTIHTVAKNLVEGGLLVVVILLLLLGSLRGGLIVASAIPLSMLTAFIAMEQLGLSGNLMSLGAIDFGLIVDGSVVMIENIIRRLHARRGEATPQLENVRAAAHQVARPVVFAVGIIILVYLPILALRGIEGKMFRPMALTVVFALAASLLLALTLMPVLASLFLRDTRETEPVLFRWAKRLYVPMLDRSLDHPRVTIGIAVGIFVIGLVLTPFLGAEFIPRLDEGAIAMQIWRLPSISLEASNEISTRAERVLHEEFAQEIDTVVSRTGRAEIATDPMGVEISDTYLMLHPRSAWRFDSKEQLVEAIEETLSARVPGAMFSFSQPIELRVSELISGVRSDVAVQIFGDDLEQLKRTADDIVRVLRQVPGASDVKAEQTTGLPMLRVRIDRQAAARLGVHADEILEVVEAVGGVPAGLVFEGQRRFALQVRFGSIVRSDLERIGALRIAAPPATPGGPRRLVPLEEVADITVEDGPAQISRERISRRISVEANVRGRDLGSFVADARAAVDDAVTLPTGWSLEWGGQFENLRSASRRLAVLVPLTLLLIFLLLYTAFGSARLASWIYLNVPLAVTGGVFALALRGEPFSISAGVGFIALFGIAVLNGVVLISDLATHTEGLAPREAARRSALRRLRPVLMTALVASFGFLPMALATSAGAEVQRPLATVVIGGLVTSTLLTLLVLPTLAAAFRGEPGSEEGHPTG